MYAEDVLYTRKAAPVRMYSGSLSQVIWDPCRLSNLEKYAGCRM